VSDWPSWKEVGFKTGDGRIETFCSVTQTVSRNPAYIFFWNELTENLWLLQLERQKLLSWFETATGTEPRNSIAVAELIVELTESKYRVRRLRMRPGGCKRRLKRLVRTTGKAPAIV
jgi:hypothetical protein